jgi:hypothetical protein
MTVDWKRDDPADSVFPNNGARRRTISLGEWANFYNQFDNWTRLSAIVSACGYLEMYIRTIVEAACQSCPATMIGGHKEVDGVKLLKTRSLYAFWEQSEACTKGTWQQRIKAYKRLFGVCPKVLVDRLSELEKLRNLRNAVGHAFGRRFSRVTIGKDVASTPFQSVKEPALLSALDLTYSVAVAIEAHLGPQYVGSYEVVAMYHLWPGRKNGFKEEAKPFSKSYFKATGMTYGRTAFGLMAKYYHSVV